ncbi:MAG: hypothetical protein OHK0029_26480 [Armatimonadaceae bacterium]
MKSERKSAVPTSVRVSESCKQLWEETASHLGLSLAATFELALRRLARAEGVLPSYSRIFESQEGYSTDQAGIVNGKGDSKESGND